MGIRSVEYVGIAEVIRDRERYLEHTISNLRDEMVRLEEAKLELQEEISLLDAEMGSALLDLGEGVEPDWMLYDQLKDKKKAMKQALSDAESDMVRAESDLRHSEIELEQVRREKDETLFEIQELARQTSEAMVHTDGMVGGYSGIGSTIKATMQQGFSALSQAAVILGGSVQAAPVRTTGAPGSGGCSGSGGGQGASGLTGPAAENTAACSGREQAFLSRGAGGSGFSSASQFHTDQGGRAFDLGFHTASGSGQNDQKPPQNFDTRQGGSGIKTGAFATDSQDGPPLVSDTQYSSHQDPQDAVNGFTCGISDEELRYLDENTADTRLLPRALDEQGMAVSAREAAFHSPFSNQEDNAGAFMPDTWKSTQVPENTVLFQLGEADGTKSCYFVDRAMLMSCMDPKTSMPDVNRIKDKLQIHDPDNQKNTLRAYVVSGADGVYAAQGRAVVNDRYGSGGGRQYFVINANAMKKNNGPLRQIDLQVALAVTGGQRQHSRKLEDFRKELVAKPSDQDKKISRATAGELREYLGRNDLATFADFGSLDQQVCKTLVRTIRQAKREFPFLRMSFVGSMQARNQFAQEKLRQHYLEAYQRANPDASAEDLRPYVEQHVKEDMKGLAIDSKDIAICYYFEEPESYGDGARKHAIGISVNEAFASDHRKVRALCEKMVQKGESPQGCTTFKSVVDHEIAHMVAMMVHADRDPDICSLFEKFRKQEPERCAELLSKYARTDIQEFIAESWSEYCNNLKPRRIAVFVGEKLKQLANQYGVASSAIQERER